MKPAKMNFGVLSVPLWVMAAWLLVVRALAQVQGEPLTPTLLRAALLNYNSTSDQEVPCNWYRIPLATFNDRCARGSLSTGNHVVEITVFKDQPEILNRHYEGSVVI
jgi:hypothetical protein